MAPRSPIRPGIPLTLADLQEARAALAPAILPTPLWVNDALSRELGASIHLKLENLQRTGSFKLRGATYKLDRLLAAGRGRSGLIAASAGNHAQGVARAAMMAGGAGDGRYAGRRVADQDRIVQKPRRRSDSQRFVAGRGPA
jgi:threonine dehydratase